MHSSSVNNLRKLAKAARLIKRAVMNPGVAKDPMSPEEYTWREEREARDKDAINTFGTGNMGVHTYYDSEGWLHATPKQVYTIHDDSDLATLSKIRSSLPDYGTVFYHDPKLRRFGESRMKGTGPWGMDVDENSPQEFIEFDPRTQKAYNSKEQMSPYGPTQLKYSLQDRLDALRKFDVQRRGFPTDNYHMSTMYSPEYEAAYKKYNKPNSELYDNMRNMEDYLFTSAFDGSVPESTHYLYPSDKGTDDLRPVPAIFRRMNALKATKRTGQPVYAPIDNQALDSGAKKWYDPEKESLIRFNKDLATRWEERRRRQERAAKLREWSGKGINENIGHAINEAVPFIANEVSSKLPVAMNWMHPVKSFVSGARFTPPAPRYNSDYSGTPLVSPAISEDPSAKWLNGIVPPTTQIKNSFEQ